MEIRTFLAEDNITGNRTVDQLISSEYFDINNDELLEKNSKILTTDNIIYISGYIEIDYFGQVFMGKKYWDYVIWLWMNIVEGIGSFIYKNTDAEILFPDQHLFIIIRPNKDYVLVEIKEPVKSHQRAMYPKREFSESLVNACLRIFTTISKYKQTKAVSEKLEICKAYRAYLDGSVSL